MVETTTAPLAATALVPDLRLLGFDPAEPQAFYQISVDDISAAGGGTYTDSMARAAINVAPTSQTGTSYTAVLGDAASYIRVSNASAIAFTIPPNTSVAFAIGTVITVEQAGVGVVTFTAGAGVTLNSRGGFLSTAGQYAVAQLKKVATNTWTVIGDVA